MVRNPQSKPAELCGSETQTCTCVHPCRPTHILPSQAMGLRGLWIQAHQARGEACVGHSTRRPLAWSGQLSGHSGCQCVRWAQSLSRCHRACARLYLRRCKCRTEDWALSEPARLEGAWFRLSEVLAQLDRSRLSFEAVTLKLRPMGRKDPVRRAGGCPGGDSAAWALVRSEPGISGKRKRLGPEGGTGWSGC